MTEKEAAAAFQEWYESLPTVDEMFEQLEKAEGPGNKAQGPQWADDED
jgi:hypothetical protein